jgi:UDP-N-acetylmuramyl pentapeptide phosphotransferase/UDP-N-acetylglucosamine-1-phosphate transferase
VARGFHPGRTVVLGAALIVTAMVGATFVWESALPGWLTAVLLVFALCMALTGWVMTFRDLSPPRRRPRP